MNLLTTRLGQDVFETALGMVMKDPEKNLPRAAAWASKVARRTDQRAMASNMARRFADPDDNWSQYAYRMLHQLRPNVVKTIATNFFLHGALEGIPLQYELKEKLGVSVPWAILMDPTERCNLRCTGCWAGDYQRSRELGLDVMDRICTEGDELGIRFYVISGGEPTVRMNDIFTLAERHRNQIFHLFSNGTLITREVARRMAELGNVTVALSLEGLEEATDARRGKGVFQKVMNTMDILREEGVIFGFSVCYTRKNTEVLGSDEFIDLMIAKGAGFGWYFTYMPIGRDVDLELMATPEQRKYMFEQIEHQRGTKPIFLMDFWNDGEASQGCIAGGRRYFHINAAGDVEPCAFVHYATCNINEVSLKEALANPVFKAYQARQPFDSNYRRPCPMIDHPEMIREIVHESGAHNTQLNEKETVDEFSAKMAAYAEQWGEMADEIWTEKHQEVR